jgi:hypothetical protein
MPIYHIIGNVTTDAAGTVTARPQRGQHSILRGSYPSCGRRRGAAGAECASYIAVVHSVLQPAYTTHTLYYSSMRVFLSARAAPPCQVTQVESINDASSVFLHEAGLLTQGVLLVAAAGGPIGPQWHPPSRTPWILSR